MSFRRIRILILLGILAGVAGATWLDRTIVNGWRHPLDIAIIPINGDGSSEAAEAIRALDEDDFADVNAFLEREVARYGVKQSPAAHIAVLPEARQLPPAPPHGGSVLETMWWSLKLRWWVYRQSDSWLPELGRIKLFLLYHSPGEGVALAHSLGLQKGLIGVVHVFADPRQARQNNIVVAHELLHTLGASDKYDAQGRPVYPVGYAEPHLPETVQRHEAEIMAGRLLGPTGQAVMPPGLERCVLGPATAYEIGLDDAFKRRYVSLR